MATVDKVVGPRQMAGIPQRFSAHSASLRYIFPRFFLAFCFKEGIAAGVVLKLFAFPLAGTK
jgi:hypothetical protein